MYRCLLFVTVFYISMGMQTRTSRADDVEDEEASRISKPSLLAISLPTAFHFETMLHIVDSMSHRYDVTIGIFDSVEYATCGDLRKYQAYNFGEFPIPSEKLNAIIRSSYHVSSFTDYFINHIFEIGAQSVSDVFQYVDMYVSHNFPDVILSDFVLPGAHLAAFTHNVSLFLFSVESAVPFLPSHGFMDRFRYMQVKKAVDQYSSSLSDFILRSNLSVADPFLMYSSPIIFTDTSDQLLPFTNTSSMQLPSNWVMIGPLCLQGFISPEWSYQLDRFFSRTDVTLRVVVYMGINNGFDAWQLKSIIGGLQDPSTQVLIVGSLPKQAQRVQRNVFFVDSTKVSIFSLLQSYSITALISYCDSLLVQAAVFHSIPLLCIPSLRNRYVINWLLQKKGCVMLPEGFWTESTVRDSLRQLLNRKKVEVDKSEWNSGYQRLNDLDLLPKANHSDSHWIEVILMRVLGCLVIFLAFLKIGNLVLSSFRKAS